WDVHQIGIGFQNLQNLTTVVFREIQVEQDQARLWCIFERAPSIQEVQPFLAVMGDIESVSDLVVRESFPSDQLVHRVVLNQQNINGIVRHCDHLTQVLRLSPRSTTNAGQRRRTL